MSLSVFLILVKGTTLSATSWSVDNMSSTFSTLSFPIAVLNPSAVMFIPCRRDPQTCTGTIETPKRTKNCLFIFCHTLTVSLEAPKSFFAAAFRTRPLDRSRNKERWAELSSSHVHAGRCFWLIGNGLSPDCVECGLQNTLWSCWYLRLCGRLRKTTSQVGLETPRPASPDRGRSQFEALSTSPMTSVVEKCSFSPTLRARVSRCQSSDTHLRDVDIIPLGHRDGHVVKMPQSARSLPSTFATLDLDRVLR
jgi:hypothetical protein